MGAVEDYIRRVANEPRPPLSPEQRERVGAFVHAVLSAMRTRRANLDPMRSCPPDDAP